MKQERIFIKFYVFMLAIVFMLRRRHEAAFLVSSDHPLNALILNSCHPSCRAALSRYAPGPEAAL